MTLINKSAIRCKSNMFIYKIKKSMLKTHRIALDKVMVIVEKAGVE